MNAMSANQRTWLFAGLALVGFAANSVLCRMALKFDLIDATLFTSIRLASGALVLWCLTRPKFRLTSVSGKAGLMLFIYAILFSFAYIQLATATGALILFGTVQMALLLIALLNKHVLRRMEWIGLIIANAGFLWLMLPDATRPPISSASMMVGAGVAWAVYTWIGRGSKQPIVDTAANFVFTVPLVFVALLLATIIGVDFHWQFSGVLLAIISGAFASGLGYVCWYQALSGLSASQAGVVQLLTPVLAAFGGIIFMQESVGIRTLVAGVVILSGIALSSIKR